MHRTYTMKIKALRSYTSKKGNKTFVYTVSGTKEQLEAYKNAQGENYREAEDGTPLWFTTRSVGAQGELIITTTGKVVPDMSAFDNAASLAKQYGGNLGAELAKHAVSMLLGSNNTPANVQSPEVKDNADIPE